MESMILLCRRCVSRLYTPFCYFSYDLKRDFAKNPSCSFRRDSCCNTFRKAFQFIPRSHEQDRSDQRGAAHGRGSQSVPHSLKIDCPFAKVGTDAVCSCGATIHSPSCSRPSTSSREGLGQCLQMKS
jgi:hypothetical protein